MPIGKTGGFLRNVVLPVGTLILCTLSAALGDGIRSQAVPPERLLTPPDDFSPPTTYTVADRAPAIRFARYPLPDTPADPWSHWGPGTVLPDGRHLSSVGDHRAIDGNSYLFLYDPATHELRRVADLQSAVDDFQPGDFGFGKIHDRLNVGADGKVYFGSYWGLRRGLEDQFRGERLFCFDPRDESLTDLGMPLSGWGYPSSNFAPDHNLYYAEITRRADYDNRTRGRRFFAFDVERREIRFMGGHEGTGYGRDLFVDTAGNAYFNNGNRTLVKYDPVRNRLEDLGPIMPVSRLRRTAGPCPDGMLYAVSADRDDDGRRVLFAFDPDARRCRTIAPLWSDTPAMALHPDGQWIYMVPGNVRYPGRPLIRVHVSDGATEVVAFLEDAVATAFDFQLGGTYNLAVDKETAYIQFGIQDDLALVTVDLDHEKK